MAEQMWPQVPLADLVEHGQISYGVVQPGSEDVAGVPIVRVKDLRNGAIQVSAPARVSEQIAERHARTVLHGGEVLVTLVGTVGEAAVVPPELAGWNVARAVAVLRPAGVAPEWLRLCFRTDSVIHQIAAAVNTTVQTTLNLSDLKRVRIPVPGAPVRRAIAEVLGALDDKIAANTRLATTADALARVDFARALGLPGVEEIAVGQCATTVLGGTPSRDELSYWTDGTVGWLNSGKANEARILQPSEWITEEALSKSAAKVMPRRATVVAITGATLGQVARLEVTASGNQSLIGIWSDEPAMNDWIYFAIQHEIPQLLRAATGAAQQHVNKRDLDALVLPILGGVDLATWGERARPLLDLAAARERENLTLAATRDALLPALMSGALRVRDAERAVEEVM